MSLLTNLFIGLSIGANVLVAHCFGAKQEEELEETVHTAMALSLVSGILLTVIGVVGAEKILILMQSPEEVRELASVYLRIYFAGMTATMVYNFGSSILRAVGDTKRPMYFLMLAGVINVVLNLIFVIVFDMSVAGVALATVISQCVSAILVVRCLMKTEGAIRLDPRKLRISGNKFVRILKVGLPAGFQGIVFSISNVLIQSSINSFGAIAVAGSSAAINLEGFVYMAMNAFYQASISFTGQNAGAGKFHRTTRVALVSQACVLGTGLLMGSVFMLFGRQLLSLYTTSPEVIEIGLVRMKFLIAPYAICGMMDVMVGIMRGLGYSILPMIVSLLGACGLRVLWILTVFQMPRFHSLEWLFVSYPITWIVTFLAHFGCYFLVRRHLKLRLGILFKEDPA